MHRELISKTESIETLKCIIQSNEKWIEQEKKDLLKMNLLAIVIYAVEFFLCKKVSIIVVISTAYFVSSHYHYMMKSRERKISCETDIDFAKAMIEIRSKECDSDE